MVENNTKSVLLFALLHVFVLSGCAVSYVESIDSGDAIEIEQIDLRIENTGIAVNPGDSAVWMSEDEMVYLKGNSLMRVKDTWETSYEVYNADEHGYDGGQRLSSLYLSVVGDIVTVLMTETIGEDTMEGFVELSLKTGSIQNLVVEGNPFIFRVWGDDSNAYVYKNERSLVPTGANYEEETWIEPATNEDIAMAGVTELLATGLINGTEGMKTAPKTSPDGNKIAWVNSIHANGYSWDGYATVRIYDKTTNVVQEFSPDGLFLLSSLSWKNDSEITFSAMTEGEPYGNHGRTIWITDIADITPQK